MRLRRRCKTSERGTLTFSLSVNIYNRPKPISPLSATITLRSSKSSRILEQTLALGGSKAALSSGHPITLKNKFAR